MKMMTTMIACLLLPFEILSPASLLVLSHSLCLPLSCTHLTLTHMPALVLQMMM